MPSQFSGYKSQLEKAQEDESTQQEMDKIKAELKGTNVGIISEQYRELYDKKEKLEQEKKQLNLELGARAQLLIDDLECTGLSQIRTEDGGTTLYIYDDIYTSAANRQEFLNWIRETKQEELLTVHYGTMNSMAKDRLSSGKPLPPGLKAYFKQSIRIRRNNK